MRTIEVKGTTQDFLRILANLAESSHDSQILREAAQKIDALTTQCDALLTACRLEESWQLFLGKDTSFWGSRCPEYTALIDCAEQAGWTRTESLHDFVKLFRHKAIALCEPAAPTGTTLPHQEQGKADDTIGTTETYDERDHRI